jgi:hypothetical protein
MSRNFDVAKSWWREVLEDAEHDRADKGERNIRCHHAQSADESHRKSPRFTSLPALTPQLVIGSGREKSAMLFYRAPRAVRTPATWLMSRKINALKSP